MLILAGDADGDGDGDYCAGDGDYCAGDGNGDGDGCLGDGACVHVADGFCVHGVRDCREIGEPLRNSLQHLVASFAGLMTSGWHSNPLIDTIVVNHPWWLEHHLTVVIRCVQTHECSYLHHLHHLHHLHPLQPWIGAY